MKFSIITICLNAEAVIERTILSVVNQTFQDFEFIIVDGKSTDKTLSIIEKYRDRINILISEKDSGIYNAQNKGIKKSSGEYLIFMNAGDCIYEKDTLEKINNSARNEDILYGDIMNDFGHNDMRLRTYPEKIGYRHWHNDFLCHQACAIKKGLFDKYGLYDESFRYVADHDFFYKVWFKKDIKKKHIPIIFCLFDMNGISGNPENEKKVRAEIHKSQRNNFPYYILILLTLRKILLKRQSWFISRKIINLYRFFFYSNFDLMSAYKRVQDKWAMESDKIKVLSICYADSIGGAARAAYRIHESLPKDSVSSILLVQNKMKLNDQSVILCIRKLGINRLGEIIINKYYSFFHVKSFRTGNKVFHSTEFQSNFNVLEAINILKPDLVHLHWVQLYFFKIEDIGKIPVPIVWTLHDMWPFCGAEHYTSDKRYIEGYNSKNRPDYESGFDLNKWVWERKKKHWEGIISKLCAVGVSDWVTGEAAKSNLFQKVKTETVWNSLDKKIFFPRNKMECRKRLGFPLEAKVILAGALNFSEDFRKGSTYILEAIKLLSEQKEDNYYLALFGSDIFIKGLGIPTMNLGSIQDDIELSKIYSAADVMVVPSLQETFGQTAIEAMACGTPVVCFDTTGLKDIVDHKENGYRANCFDSKDLLVGIQWVTSTKEQQEKLSKNAIQKVDKNFTYETTGLKYVEIYKKLLS